MDAPFALFAVGRPSRARGRNERFFRRFVSGVCGAPSAVEDRLAEAYTETAGAVFERPVQAAWGKITLSPALEKLDFLKAGHHGSASSTGEMLASLCAPDALFISCGAGNTYGHPNLSCMKNVLAASPDAEIYRTDELGNIMLTVRDGGEYSVRFG